MASERNKTISDITGFGAGNHSKMASLVKEAASAIGKQNLLGTKTENDSKIIEWLRVNRAKSSNALPATQSNALPATQQKRNKTKRVARATDLIRVSFGGTGNTKRYHLTLEAEYVEALKRIAPHNRNEWLLSIVARHPNENESPTRIIKTQIVKTLLTMI